MIDFNCTRCHEPYSVPEELAGTDLQCTKCGLLLSVPLPSMLSDLNPDGTLRVADALPLENADRLSNLARAFGKNRIDAFGEEIDNRTLPETIELVPILGPPKRLHPQYDPETGELVRPLEVAEPVLPPIADAAPEGAVPTAQVSLGYRPRGAAVDEPRRVAPNAVKLELFQPLNVFVMLILAAMHVMFNVSFAVVNGGIVFFVIGPLVLMFIIVGHYGNVIDEIGPTDMDELPRPLRTVSFYDDIWSPFCHVSFSLALTAFPLLYLLQVIFEGAATLETIVLPLVALAATTFFLPVLLLTLHTSGTLLNARPDRMIGVIRAAGKSYLMVWVIGFFATIFYVGGTVGALYSLLHAMGAVKADLGHAGRAPITYTLLLVGIYLTHLFCWRVGLLYRMYHPKFPWVHQEHTRAKKDMSRARLSAQERAALLKAKEATRQRRQQAAAIESMQGRTHM